MNAVTQIDRSDLVLAHIDTLSLSAMNPRQHVTDQEIGELADSLIKCGLIQNLSGFYDGTTETIEIVAGGRRLRALRMLADQGFVPASDSGLDLTRIPVKITRDSSVAAEWAMGENVARKALNVADEVQAYQALADRGIAASDIARAFAVTDVHVKRRLKLATLPEAVMDALRAEKIGYGQAAVLTLCPDEARVLELLEMALERNWSEQNMRNHISREAVTSADRRAIYVGLDAYEAAGGGITRDMFTTYAEIHDEGLLHRLFEAKLREEADVVATDGGFRWATAIFDSYVSYEVSRQMNKLWPEEVPLSEEESAEYDALAELDEADALDSAGADRMADLEEKQAKDYSPAQREVSGVFVYVTRDGALQLDAAYVTPQDFDLAVEKGVLRPRATAASSSAASGAAADNAPASPFSAAVLADMKAIRLSAVQSALIDKPELLLDLLAFAISPVSGSYSTIFDMRLGRPSIAPSIEDAFEPDARLNQGNALKVDQTSAFAKFRKLTKKARAAALSEAVARALNYGCTGAFNGKPEALFGDVEAEAGASIRRIWRPTKENFFGRVTGGYLDEIYSHIFALDAASAEAKAFAALKKGEKASRLGTLFDLAHPDSQGFRLMSADAADRIAAWLPSCF